MAVGCKPPIVPCQVGFSIGKLTTWQLASSEGRARNRQRVRTRWKSVFFNLISEVIITLLLLYSIYLKQVIRSSPDTRGRGRNYIRTEYQKSGIIRGHFRVSYHRCSSWWRTFINIVVRWAGSEAIQPALKSWRGCLIAYRSEQVT